MFSQFRLIIPLLFISLISAGAHSYLWSRLFAEFVSRGPPLVREGFGVTFWTLAVLLPLPFLSGNLLPPRPLRWLSLLAASWMGLIFYLLFFTGLSELGLWLSAWGEHTHAHGSLIPSELQWGICAAALLFAGLGLRGGARRPTLREVEIRLPRLDPSFDGLTIVQLSDIHVGSTIGGAFLKELVDETMHLKPDLIALTGDLIDGSVKRLASALEPLRTLSAPEGVFFVTGNHEYFSGAKPWIPVFETLGLQVLQNRHVSLQRGEASLAIAGVDDWIAARFPDGGRADLNAALEGKAPEVPVILLAHQPKAVHEAAERGVDLQLSGHTHGGQIFPFNLFVRLEQPFVSGLHQVKETLLYVHQGSGYWGPPMRLASTAEITRIRLRSGRDPSGELTKGEVV